MENYQLWFEKYWKLRRARILIRNSNLPVKEKFARMKPIMRAMREYRHKIEREMFLFPNQSLYIPGE